jgi:hypothetical protein
MKPPKLAAYAKDMAAQLRESIHQLRQRPEEKARWGDSAYATDLARMEKWIRQLDEGKINEAWREVQYITRILGSMGDTHVREIGFRFRKAVLEAVVEARRRE